MNNGWIVQRVDENSVLTRTLEMSEDEAKSLYAAWSRDIRQSVSVIKVSRVEQVEIYGGIAVCR